MDFATTPCTLCPRRCGALRAQGPGLCGGGALPKVARAALHHWEEPCISGTRGSGTVFFSGCSLGCVFCQNYAISTGGYGKEISTARLAEIFRELEEAGAHNINLVNPTHFVPQIREALALYRPGVPVVYNSSGYERVETLRQLEGLVDIYLPDLKYVDSTLSGAYSGAGDYLEFAGPALLEMRRQQPLDVVENGLMGRGLIVRHLVLPGAWEDSLQVLEWVAAHLSNKTYVSLMSQYTPAGRADQFPALAHPLPIREYRRANARLVKLGFTNGFVQQPKSADVCYIPPFQLEGVERKEIL